MAPTITEHCHPLEAKAVPVRDHRFGSGREYTVGIEEELMLVGAGDLALTPGVERILAAVPDERVKTELMQCQIEVASSPQRYVADALADLLSLRARVIRAGEAFGIRTAAAGTHPFSCSETQALTVRDRYRELVAEMRYPLQREVCFGMHVHVAVGGADKAVQLIEALLPDTPLLLALSASSPFWRGEPTGLHSTPSPVRHRRGQDPRRAAERARRRRHRGPRPGARPALRQPL
jgi:carboxylate-amine ligase